jgi:hypothetical protein
MGPDLILVGIGSGIGHFIDFSGLFFVDNNASVTVLRGSGRDLALTATYAFLCFICYLVVLQIHQAYDPNQNPTRAQRIFWLGFFSNIFGATALAALFFLLRHI